MQLEASQQIEKLDPFADLVTKFRALPDVSPRPTFMDVAGYPHYENVCSNILAFYLNPTEAHGLGNLVLRSLLRTLGHPDVSLGQTTVERERMTFNGGRLDLLIDTEIVTIGIEHKVYATVYNDLDDYAKTVDGYAASISANKKTLKVVLSLTPAYETQRHQGWHDVTHTNLWREVRALMGDYAGNADLKWLTYLLEFMQSMSNLAGDNVELKAVEQFFVDHSETIDQLIATRQDLLRKLSARRPELLTLLSSLVSEKIDKGPYLYSTDRIVLDLSTCLSGSQQGDAPEIAFDLFVGTKGWDLQMFGRGACGGAYWSKLIGRPPLASRLVGAKELDRGLRLSIQQWPPNADLVEVATAVASWIDAVHHAAAYNPATLG